MSTEKIKSFAHYSQDLLILIYFLLYFEKEKVDKFFAEKNLDYPVKIWYPFFIKKGEAYANDL